MTDVSSAVKCQLLQGVSGVAARLTCWGILYDEDRRQVWKIFDDPKLLRQDQIDSISE